METYREGFWKLSKNNKLEGNSKTLLHHFLDLMDIYGQNIDRKFKFDFATEM